MKVSRIYLIIIIICVIIIGLSLSGIFEKTAISKFQLTANKVSASGIDKNATFRLVSTENLSESVIEKNLIFLPSIDFDVERVKESPDNNYSTYQILPKEELKENTVYQISIDDGPITDKKYSWAYQVKSPFQIIGSIPRNKSTFVPINSSIEITFNREDIVDPEKNIEISPAVQGQFIAKNNVITFVSSRPMKKETVYTVTIKKELRSKDNENLDENHVFSFETTGDENQEYARLEKTFSEFKPGTNATFTIYGNLSSVPVKVYKFADANEFVESFKTANEPSKSWSRYNAIKVDTNRYRKLLETIMTPQVEGYSRFITIPQALDKGYYLLELTSNSSNYYGWFQVSDISSYLAMASKKSLIWLKNNSNGESVANATIKLDGKELAKTQSDGVALFDTPSQFIRKVSESRSASNFFVANMNNAEIVIPAQDKYEYRNTVAGPDEWWDYISFDKNIYMPTDTINVWAIAKPRDGRASDDYEVRLTKPSWAISGDEPIYAHFKSESSGYGTITGTLSYENLTPGLYVVSILNGGDIVASRTVSISRYVKPLYKLSIIPSSFAVFAGEQVTYNIKAEFFDGTPVPNMKLRYSGYGPADHFDGTVNLDGSGEGIINVTVKPDNSNFDSNYLTLNISNSTSEEALIEASASVIVVNSRYDLNIDQKIVNSQNIFNGVLYSVDLSQINAPQPIWGNRSYWGPALAGRPIGIRVYRYWYVPVQTSTYYDEINKLSYPIFRYDYKEELIENKQITTGPDGSFNYSFNPNEGDNYKVIFEVFDENGRRSTDVRYIWRQNNEYSEDSFTRYILLKNKDGKYKYSINELVTLSLSDGTLPLANVTNGYIFIWSNNGILSYKIQDSSTVGFNFEESFIPNVYINAAKWNGSNFYADSYGMNISFNEEDRRLKISVDKDKDKYKPGEEVNLKIKITDKAGSPLKSEVNIFALDEAVFSIRKEELDIVNEIYRDIYSDILIIRSSHIPPRTGSGAEKGGGDDGGYPRSNIKDVAVIKTVETNSRGEAAINFKLPDNLTSWRLTVQAVTKNLHAAKKIEMLSVSLPFFVETTLNATYLAGDNLVMRLRTFGSQPDDIVKYKIESETLPFRKIEQTGGPQIHIDVGKLVTGKHSIKISATSNRGNVDSILREINVLNTYHSLRVMKFIEAKNNREINNKGTGDTTLSFLSLGRGKYYEELARLSYGEYGSARADQKLGAQISKKMMEKYFGVTGDDFDFDYSKYSLESGGLALLPYGDTDLEMTAKFANIVSDFEDVDKKMLRSYFNHSLGDKKADIARISQALYGLSALGEPVLNKINEISSNKGLKIKDKIYIALALQNLGAHEQSKEYYLNNIAPNSGRQGLTRYIKHTDFDDQVLGTILVASLLSGFDDEQASAFYDYASYNFPKSTLTNFERLIYLKSVLPKLSSEPIQFTYEISGKKRTKKIEKGEVFRLDLPRRNLSDFKIYDIKGELGILMEYIDDSKNLKIQDRSVRLTRSYSVDGVPKTNLIDGDLVKVELYGYIPVNASRGIYEVRDYLPSGLKPISAIQVWEYQNYHERYYPVEIDGQMVRFILWQDTIKPMIYFARVVGGGTYRADNAIIQSLVDLNSINLSEPTIVNIK